jgi:5-methyltetrahydropteroyltriglutamate--homocysteine methyltransferase
MSRDRPPFRADHVGSFLRPKPLLEARERAAAGGLGKAELRAIEDRHIRDVVAMQESAGLRAVTDGEFRRTFWHLDFIEKIGGVKLAEGSARFQFQGTGFRPKAPITDAKLTHPGTIMGEDFAYLKSVAKVTPKVCIPSPTIVHFRNGRAGVSAAAYPDIGQYFSDLAAVYNAEMQGLAKLGCRYLQIDETNFAYLCDEKQRAATRAAGEDPAKLPAIYAKLISDSVRGRPADMATTMHICRGNFKGTWMAEGGYEPVAEAIFSTEVDGFFLEYDDARSGGFEPLRFVPKGKMVVLGLVTTKKGALERKDDLKRRIDEAAKYVPLDQICLSPQCGFSSTVDGNALSVAEQIAKLRLIVETASEVWG